MPPQAAALWSAARSATASVVDPGGMLMMDHVMWLLAAVPPELKGTRSEARHAHREFSGRRRLLGGADHDHGAGPGVGEEIEEEGRDVAMRAFVVVVLDLPANTWASIINSFN